MQKLNRFVRTGLIVAPSVLAVAAMAAAGTLYQRVRAFDAKHECDVLAGLSPAELKQNRDKVAALKPDEDSARTAVTSSSVATNVVAKPVLAVERVEHDGDRRLSVVFNERPDMDVIRNYVKVGPLAEGTLGFAYRARYSNRKGDYEPVVTITGEYAYRTNVTLKILKGFPLYGKGANPDAEGSLTNDFTFVFHRRDPAPAVDYADSGRYLPPGGRNAVRVEAISVTNVATEICRVEPRNVVQLLAREERKYEKRSWWNSTADEEDTQELSGEVVTGFVRCVNRPCEKEICLMPVAMRDGGPERGIFLVSVRNGDRPRDEYRWSSPKYNPNLYRLVCLSDLGLSVRRGKQGLGVWVVSLTSGRPVADAHVEVYSAANILLAEGESDRQGWCEPKQRTEGKPFAVVVWTANDMTFLALADSMRVDETCADGARPGYLGVDEVDAFAWTERGIYRHGERIFVHALVRDSRQKAARPLPIVLKLMNPKGNAYAAKTLIADGEGSLTYDGFAVADEQPSGKWMIQVCLPGKGGRVLAEREIKVEEFAPPQIRVNVTADETQHPSNFTFKVAAEHLFGGPARALACEGAVVFEDVPFAPARWRGFTFGNEQLGLKPCFRRLSRRVLDDAGECAYDAPLWADSGRPKAAVRATGQGVVFEDGGHPATARKSLVCHYYPFYIGSNLPSWLKCPATGLPKIDVVCVDHQGNLIAKPRRLIGRIDRIDSVYSYRKKDDGQSTWDCERVRTNVRDGIPLDVDATGRLTYQLPMRDGGDYVLTIVDPGTGSSFGRTFYLSDWGDDVVRAPLSDPTEVTIRADKSFYRAGERPRLVVKSPFAGYALMSVLRDDVVYEEILNLTNATSEVVLRPVERDWAPNVDVSISVVQSVDANVRHLAARAHGRTTIRVRPVENEIEMKLDASVVISGADGVTGSGARVTATIEAPGATSAVVTLVDEGIHLLTGELVPDPVGRLSRARKDELPLYDLYGRILPVAEDGLRKSGVKTGGGFGAEMLGRVSPVPTRRFRPLALWQAKVSLTNGIGRAVFELPEFVGEVRVTAVAYSASATGAASVRRKVTPKLVVQPDAPRFVAPQDSFAATMTLRNRSGADGEARYEFRADAVRSGTVFLRNGESTNLVFADCRGKPTDGEAIGNMMLTFAAEGFGERHRANIELPVRPAVAWRTRCDVVRLDPGETLSRVSEGEAHRFAVLVGASPLAEYASAIGWLADYPHGCLEQTASRIFPLVTAGGILNSIAARQATNREEYVAAGVRRVESMIRENDFVMWPDVTYAPWDREVSLYAAHFLVEAERAGQRLDPSAKDRVLKFLKKWALSENNDESAYACHTLALAGRPEKDRMFRLYDQREKLGAIARARLARGFVAIHDAKRAEALMAYAIEPQSVKEAAFSVLALTDLNPEDVRLPKLIDYLSANRDKQRHCWGTTAENAHALLAIGAYSSHHPLKDGEVLVEVSGLQGGRILGKRESATVDAPNLTVTNRGPATAFLTVREQWLNDPKDVSDEANGIFLSRRYWRTDGTPADLNDLVRGELLIAELTITSDVTRVVSDLVIEDLFAGAFEPVHRELTPELLPSASSAGQVQDWVLRKDARDDRMLVFSKKFELRKDHEAKVHYPVRVTSAGDFVLPGPSVEGMYCPALRARCVPGRLVVRP